MPELGLELWRASPAFAISSGLYPFCDKCPKRFSHPSGTNPNLKLRTVPSLSPLVRRYSFAGPFPASSDSKYFAASSIKLKSRFLSPEILGSSRFKTTPALPARIESASGNSTPSIIDTNLNTSPPALHPKQWKISLEGET